jgi:hypothetical protein
MATYSDYTVIAARNAADLATFVSDRIADGWQPYGYPVSAFDGLLIQALAKVEPETPETP